MDAPPPQPTGQATFTAVALEHAVRACPFLHAVALQDGPEAARRIATQPARPGAACPARPPVAGEPATPGLLAATYRAFHVGPAAVVPLAGPARPACPFAAAAAGTGVAVRLPPAARAEGERAASTFSLEPRAAAPVRRGGCPSHAGAGGGGAVACGDLVGESSPGAPASARALVAGNGALTPRPHPLPLSAAPFASMSLPFGGLPDPADFIRRHRLRLKQQAQQAAKKKADPPRPRPPAASSGGGGSVRTAAPAATPPQPPPGPPPLLPRKPRSGGPPRPHAATTAGSAPASAAASAGAGGCPLRSLPVLGALIPLAANGVDLACPPAILALRSAVARLPAVRALRPRPLLTRGLAVTAVGAAAAAPFGAWRVHLRKFSPGWFLAVHATVPFVAALRQATAMPRWALVLTIAGSVAGQLAGAALERARLEAAAAVDEAEEAEAEAARAAAAARRRGRRLPALPSLPRWRSGGCGDGAAAAHLARSATAVVVA